ncbi:hypothetical protein [Dactylosporangium sp. NPDC005555]|uniref:hypothetical protein n=1 Tax=Dactylosporangium sp. NPDC005555 TaxID=3154889 RepID=UPI0033BDAAE4
MAVQRDPASLSWRRITLTVVLHAALLVWMCTPVIWLVVLVKFVPEDDTAAAVVVHLSALVFAVVVPLVVVRVARRTERELQWAIWWLAGLLGLVLLGVFDIRDTVFGP